METNVLQSSPKPQVLTSNAVVARPARNTCTSVTVLLFNAGCTILARVASARWWYNRLCQHTNEHKMKPNNNRKDVQRSRNETHNTISVCLRLLSNSDLLIAKREQSWKIATLTVAVFSDPVWRADADIIVATCWASASVLAWVTRARINMCCTNFTPAVFDSLLHFTDELTLDWNIAWRNEIQ